MNNIHLELAYEIMKTANII